MCAHVLERLELAEQLGSDGQTLTCDALSLQALDASKHAPHLSIVCEWVAIAGLYVGVSDAVEIDSHRLERERAGIPRHPQTDGVC